MNVTLKNIDGANALASVRIEKADYQEKVEKSLKNIRQKANIPGFRKGMTPMGMIKKMYGKSVLAEEINKLVGESLYGHIRENKVNILGEPLPNTTEQKEIDFDTQDEFEFLFDLGLVPEIKINLSKEDVVNFYNVTISQEMIDRQVSAYTERNGKYEQAESVEGKDMVKGLLVELDENGSAKEGGLQIEGAVMIPAYLKDETEKELFTGATKGSDVVFNPKKACGGNEYEIAHILKVQKEEAAAIESNFKLTIQEITRHIPAAIDQTLFDTVYGEGVVTSEADFYAKIRESIAAQLQPESDYKFWIDARPVIEEKVGALQLPNEFLKRWLLASGENKTPESVEEEFPAMVKELTWHLIKEEIAKANDVKVEEADMLNVAKMATRAQFAGYGMMDVPADILDKYAADMMKDEKARRNLVERAVEDKIRDAVKALVSLNEIEISQEDFYKLFQDQN